MSVKEAREQEREARFREQFAADGNGSIYPYANGGAKSRWAAKKDLPPGYSRRRVVVYAATPREAAAKLTAKVAAIERGEVLTDERLTVATYLASWLERVERDVRPSTHQRYVGICAKQIVPLIGDIRLAKLHPTDVARMLTAIQAQGLSRMTAVHTRAVLRTALADAVDFELIGRNAVTRKTRIKPSPPRPTILPVEEVHRVLDAVAGTDVERPVTFALYTGLRAGEVLGLRWTDVDLDTGTLTVTQALQRLGKTDVLVPPKSETSRRTLRLSVPAIETLRAERQAQLEAQLAAGRRWRPTIPGLVFTTATGSPRKNTTMTAAFKRALRNAGLPTMRFHDLRHLHACHMLASGADISVISRLLGHSSMTLTVSTYAGVLPSLKAETADRFAAHLARPAAPAVI